jgi:hypothetical protein
MEQEWDGSLTEFIVFLFSSQPKAPKSIQLSWQDIIGPSESFHDDLFQCLLEIWTLGMKSLFAGPDGVVNLDYLNAENVQLIEAYLNSIGFTIYYQRTPHDHSETSGRWPPPDGPLDRLNVRVLRLNTPTALYEISFDFL